MSRLSKTLAEAYVLACGGPRLARLHTRLFHLSARVLGLHNYESPRLSGERWIIRQRLRDATAPVVFDVGANVGDWSAAVRAVNRRAEIHAFEPQGALATAMAARCPDIRVTHAAVGDSTGSLDLFDYADAAGSQHASVVPGVIDVVHRGRPRQTTVPVLTLDDYCAEHGIAGIDFLKVDVEGYDLQVLRGARRLLAGGKIGVIQFEFTHINAHSRVFINDFAACLGGRYRLHRLLPHGLLPLRPNDCWFNEQFGYQNIVALPTP